MTARIIPLFPLSQCGPSQGFDEWFAFYPRRVAKAEALKAYMQQLRRGFIAVDMVQGAKCFAEMCRMKGTEPDYIPHPATWLRGERWQDEELAEYIPKTPEQIADSKDRADRIMRRGKFKDA